MFRGFGSSLMPRLKVKSLIALIVITLPIAIQAAGASGPESLYQWPREEITSPPSGEITSYRVGFVDSFAEGNLAAEGRSFISVSGSIQPICSGFDDPQCLNLINSKQGSWWSNVVLNPCSATTYQVACIEDVFIKEGTGKRSLTLGKTLSGYAWKEKTGFVPAGSPSLWKDSSGAQSIDGYVVTVNGPNAVLGQVASPSGSTLVNFAASIIPYKVTKGNYSGPTLSDNNGYQRYSYSAPNYCIWAENGECGYRVDFPEGARLGLTLHVPNSQTGFLIGRMSKPEISVETSTSTYSKLSIEADPIKVPLFEVEVSAKDADQELVDWYKNRRNYLCSPYPSCLSGKISTNTTSSYEAAFTAFNLYKNYLPDNASISLPVWSVRSVADGLKGCSSDGQFLGLVTTNAAIYEGKPPVFKDGFLEYKVAGVHNNPDGKVFQGKYDLVLNTKTARCLYKYSAAPIGASVSIINNEGSTNIQTTTFTEKKGWSYLSVNGFTFSSPTIKVKLTQDTVKAEPTPEPSKAAKTKTITCVKGKNTKKVTGLSPKCPLGYKAK